MVLILMVLTSLPTVQRAKRYLSSHMLSKEQESTTLLAYKEHKCRVQYTWASYMYVISQSFN
jgi:hypothetical protein